MVTFVRTMAPWSRLILIFVVFASLSSLSEARIGEQWKKDHQPRRRLSLEELSTGVFEELQRLHTIGPAGSLQVPQVARIVHRIVVEGSANEGELFDDEAQYHASRALQVASDLYKNMSSSVPERDLQLYRSEDYGDRQLQAAGDIAGKVLFAAFLVYLVVLVVKKLVEGIEGPDGEWPWLKEVKGEAFGPSFKRVKPCDQLPLAPNEKFGYLPITSPIVTFLADAAGSDTVTLLEVRKAPFKRSFRRHATWFSTLPSLQKTLFDPRNLANTPNAIVNADDCYEAGSAATCEFTAECCKTEDFLVDCNDNQVCEQTALTDLQESDLTLEPFCLLWSKSDSNDGFIDTLGFAPRGPWPPVAFHNIKSLPSCPKSKPCTKCEYASGWPVTQFNIGPITFQALFRFRGIALSWADNAKLAFGTNAGTSNIEIWDGFRNQPLPVVPDINFWVSFRFTIMDFVSYKLGESECKSKVGGGFLDELKSGLQFNHLIAQTYILQIEIDFEIYVAFDKQTEGDGAGANLAGNLAGKRNLISSTDQTSYSEGNRVWRSLQDTTSEDPCIIITMTALRVTLPQIGSLTFATAVGGSCNFSPEETGVRCTPSGFFFNIDQKFIIEGGILGYVHVSWCFSPKICFFRPLSLKFQCILLFTQYLEFNSF
jgi:hypothetical protein